MQLELYYHRTWGIINISLGIIFSLIFIIGAIFLNDNSFFYYLILTGGNIILGIIRLKKPYVLCSEIRNENDEITSGEIKVLNSFGQVQYRYEYKSTSEITVVGNRLCQNGTKLKFNSWFINKHQWNKIIRYYTDGKLPADDLQDL